MKKIIFPLIIASSSLNAQTVTEPVTGSGVGTITSSMINTVTDANGDIIATEAGTASFDFAPNGGSGTASATSIFSNLGGGGNFLSFSQVLLSNPTGSSNLEITFDTAGEYTISLLDFDITTINPSLYTVSAGFTDVATGVGANGSALGGSFTSTQTSPTAFSFDVVDSGELAANSTNGFISLTYDVTAGQTLSFDYDDTNGIQDALAFRVTQNEFVTSVPEPSASALLGLGALALLARRRR